MSSATGLLDPTINKSEKLRTPEDEARIILALDRLSDLAEGNDTDDSNNPLNGLRGDLENWINDPLKLDELVNALERWGNSPYADGSKGEDGRGTHAGVEHFFGYRLDRRKAERWGHKGMNLPPTIDAFVRLSNELGEAVNNPNDSDHVTVANDMIDLEGNTRRIGNYDNNLFIAYRAVGEGEFRVSSVFDTKGAPDKAQNTVIRDSEGYDPENEAKKINQLKSKPSVSPVVDKRSNN